MNTILVADNDRHILQGFERELDVEGHGALLARNVDEARTLLGRRDVDVFVIDADLPGDVQGLLSWVSDRLPQVPIIIFSGAITWLAESLARFAFAVVDKGAPWEELLGAIDRALARKAVRAEGDGQPCARC